MPSLDPDVITAQDITDTKEIMCFLEDWTESTNTTINTPGGQNILTLFGISSSTQVATNTANIAINAAAIASLAGVAPIAVTQYTTPGAGSHSFNPNTKNYLVITVAGGGGGGGAGTSFTIFSHPFGDCAGGGGGSGAVSAAWASGSAPLSNAPFTLGAGGAAGAFDGLFNGSPGGNSIFQQPGGGSTICGSFGGGGGFPGRATSGQSSASLGRGGIGGTISGAIGDIFLPGRQGDSSNLTGFAGVDTNGITTNGSVVNIIGGNGAGGFLLNGTGNGGNGGSFLRVSDPVTGNRTPTSATNGSAGSIIVLEYE